MKVAAPIYHHSAPPEFSNLLKLNLEGILRDFSQRGAGLPQVTVEGFLNGEQSPMTETEKKSLLEGSTRRTLRDRSFRMTNLQLFVPELKEFCLDLGARHGSGVNVNLYFTPQKTAKCFVFHSDFHKSLIYQIEGTKEWTFLKREGEFLGNRPGTRVDAKETDGRHVVTLVPGSFLEVPLGLVHEAIGIDESPSVHLTFSLPELTRGMLMEEILSQGMGFRSLADSNRIVEMDDLRKLLPPKPEECHKSLNDQLRDLSEYVLRRGKPYL